MDLVFNQLFNHSQTQDWSTNGSVIHFPINDNCKFQLCKLADKSYNLHISHKKVDKPIRNIWLSIDNNFNYTWYIGYEGKLEKEFKYHQLSWIDDIRKEAMNSNIPEVFFFEKLCFK